MIIQPAIKLPISLCLQQINWSNYIQSNKKEKLYSEVNLLNIKGELQRQSKLISSKRPSKILQNETKIVKIRLAVLEIFNFKDLDLNSFPRRKRLKTENVVLEVLQN